MTSDTTVNTVNTVNNPKVLVHFCASKYLELLVKERGSGGQGGSFLTIYKNLGLLFVPF